MGLLFKEKDIYKRVARVTNLYGNRNEFISYPRPSSICELNFKGKIYASGFSLFYTIGKNNIKPYPDQG